MSTTALTEIETRLHRLERQKSRSDFAASRVRRYRVDSPRLTTRMRSALPT